MSDIENLREQNIQRNKLMLQKLGLLGQNAAERKKPVRKLSHLAKMNGSSALKTPSSSGKKRFSARLQRSGADGLSDNFVNGDGYISDEGFETHTSSTKKIKRMNSYGHIEGIEVGESWLTRLECSNSGVHRPTVAGIHAGHDGAYSIALSGGYVDDVDCGETFTYTGAGGRDLKGTSLNPKNLRTAPQTKDQTLGNFNKSLVTSAQTKNPVRVIRGYKLGSSYAPEEGYRYDGLYTVEKYWTAVGLSGFLVYKFSLKRCDGQASPPWMVTEPAGSTDIPHSHLHDISDISRNNSVQAIDSFPTGRVKSRRQPVKFSSVPNQSSDLQGKLDCKKEDDVTSIINKDFNISNENSSTVNNCINNENSRRKRYYLTSSYDNATWKSKKVDSCATSFVGEKHSVNKKHSERTSSESQNRVSLLTKISSSPGQKNHTSKKVSNNEKKLVIDRQCADSKISVHVNESKQGTSLQDATVMHNGEKSIETSMLYLTEVSKCNLLKSLQSPNAVISGTKRCRYSGVSRCLNTSIEKPLVLLKKMSEEQIDTIMSAELQSDIGNKLKKKTPKSTVNIDCITKFNNLNKSDNHSCKILTFDNISQETESRNKKIHETKLIKKLENIKDGISHKTIKTCCVQLFRFDKHSNRNVFTGCDNTQILSKEDQDLWCGWDDIGKQDFLGFNESDLSKAAWSSYLDICNYSESLSKCITEKKCANNEEDIWRGW